jgi:hypothetical protein
MKTLAWFSTWFKIALSPRSPLAMRTWAVRWIIRGMIPGTPEYLRRLADGDEYSGS